MDWKKTVQPLITALVAFLAAATLYLQRSTTEENDAWQSRTETRIEYLESRSAQRDVDFKDIRAVLSDVRADISFVRGVLESKKR